MGTIHYPIKRLILISVLVGALWTPAYSAGSDREAGSETPPATQSQHRGAQQLS